MLLSANLPYSSLCLVGNAFSQSTPAFMQAAKQRAAAKALGGVAVHYAYGELTLLSCCRPALLLLLRLSVTTQVLVGVYFFVAVMGCLLGIKRFEYALLLLPLAVGVLVFHVLVSDRKGLLTVGCVSILHLDLPCCAALW
jgi:hypothetical protein